jgi:four helix bundle protein
MAAARYEDLDVWRLCDEIRRLVHEETARDAARADRKFCQQILDSAEDAVADIAEGFGRFNPREFAQFLGYAITSTAEVRERTRFAFARQYFRPETAARLIVLCVRADKALRALRRYLWTVAPQDVPYHPSSRRARGTHRGNPSRRS